jgi:hypothetical protein
LLDGYQSVGTTDFRTDSYAVFGEVTWHATPRLALTGGDASLDRFPERLLLDEAFERDRSFASVARFMAPGTGEGSALDAPPLALFAERAAGVGFVNSRPDWDGEHRRVPPFWATPYGALPQFGLAAGLLQLGIAPRDVKVEGGALVFPDGRRMPLEGRDIRVDWPTSVFESDPQRLRGDGETGVVAIGALVDLGRQRTVLADQERRYRDLLSDIAALQGLTPEAAAKVPVDEPTRAAIKEQGEVARPNPNSAAVWHYPGFDADGNGKLAFEETMHRTCGTVAIKDGLLYVADFSGLFHCLDLKTGKPHYTHDMLAASWGSPLIVDGKVYVGDEDGDISVFRLAPGKELLAEINMGNSVYSTPIAVGDTLYIANKSHLFAIREGAQPPATE